MTRGSLSRRPLEGLLRAGQSVVVLVALLALFSLTSVPHHHAGSTEERSCPACQVSRSDGGAPPETTSVDLPGPAGVAVPVPLVPPDVAGLTTRVGPGPSRGPPPVSFSEQL